MSATITNPTTGKRRASFFRPKTLLMAVLALGLIAAVLVLVAIRVGSTPEVPMLRDHAARLLHEMSAGYKELAADSIVARYHETATVNAPDQAEVTEENGVHLSVTASPDAASRTVSQFQNALAKELARFEKVHKAKFYFDAVNQNEDGTYTIHSWFIFKATCPDGTKCSEESKHQFVVDNDSEAMQVMAHKVLERRRVEGKEVHFAERTEDVGLAFQHQAHAEIGDGTPIIPGNFSGSGASAGDLDGDGYLDVVVGDGKRSRLFRNENGKFTDITDALETAAGGAIDVVRGAYLVDVDDDGLLDVVFTRVKKPIMVLRNLGKKDGKLCFEDQSERMASFTPGQTESAAFADLDGDGDLDAFVQRYGDWDESSWAYPIYQATDGVSDGLLRNDGGTFVELDIPEATPPGWGLATTMADFDNDGDQDIYIANDFGNNHLIRNDGNWTFTNVTEATGAADQGYGMSAAFGDHDNDGDLDIYISNMHSSQGWVFQEENFPMPVIGSLFYRNEMKTEMAKMLRGNTLLQNNNGSFAQMAPQLGCERNGWAWGANFVDYDNDGDLDIYSPNGYITGEEAEDC